jgi:hypothetical protein
MCCFHVECTKTSDALPSCLTILTLLSPNLNSLVQVSACITSSYAQPVYVKPNDVTGKVLLG